MSAYPTHLKNVIMKRGEPEDCNVGRPSSDKMADARRLGEIIQQNQQEIERRWVRRVETDIAASPGIEPTQLRDGLRDHLSALVKLFSQTEAESLDLALVAGAFMVEGRE